MVPPSPPRLSVPIDQALSANESLSRLTARVQASRACLAQLRPLLPEALFAQLRPGPIDDQGWTLLVPNGAVAAKLRQMLPELQAALAQGGSVAPKAIKLRILATQ